jgi:hypothetical protein
MQTTVHGYERLPMKKWIWAMACTIDPSDRHRAFFGVFHRNAFFKAFFLRLRLARSRASSSQKASREPMQQRRTGIGPVKDVNHTTYMLQVRPQSL